MTAIKLITNPSTLDTTGADLSCEQLTQLGILSDIAAKEMSKGNNPTAKFIELINDTNIFDKQLTVADDGDALMNMMMRIITAQFGEHAQAHLISGIEANAADAPTPSAIELVATFHGKSVEQATADLVEAQAAHLPA